MSQALLLSRGALRGLPSAPDPEIDIYIDAAARCFARHGIRRTSMNDIAREASISRATAYRQLGSVDNAALLLLARDLHRVLSGLPARIAIATGPAAIAAIVAMLLDEARCHPVVKKVLADEPEPIGRYAIRHLPEILLRIHAVLDPILHTVFPAEHRGAIAPEVLTDVLVRVGLTALVAPPPSGVEDYLGQIIHPLLRGSGRSSKAGGRPDSRSRRATGSRQPRPPSEERT